MKKKMKRNETKKNFYYCSSTLHTLALFLFLSLLPSPLTPSSPWPSKSFLGCVSRASPGFSLVRRVARAREREKTSGELSFTFDASGRRRRPFLLNSEKHFLKPKNKKQTIDTMFSFQDRIRSIAEVRSLISSRGEREIEKNKTRVTFFSRLLNSIASLEKTKPQKRTPSSSPAASGEGRDGISAARGGASSVRGRPARARPGRCALPRLATSWSSLGRAGSSFCGWRKRGRRGRGRDRGGHRCIVCFVSYDACVGAGVGGWSFGARKGMKSSVLFFVFIYTKMEER